MKHYRLYYIAIIISSVRTKRTSVLVQMGLEIDSEKVETNRYSIKER